MMHEYGYEYRDTTLFEKPRRENERLTGEKGEEELRSEAELGGLRRE